MRLFIKKQSCLHFFDLNNNERSFSSILTSYFSIQNIFKMMSNFFNKAIKHKISFTSLFKRILIIIIEINACLMKLSINFKLIFFVMNNVNFYVFWRNSRLRISRLTFEYLTWIQFWLIFRKFRFERQSSIDDSMLFEKKYNYCEK